MKITLGGKLSILIALLYLSLWGILEIAGPSAYHVQIAVEKVLGPLSFPLLWVSAIFFGAHLSSPQIAVNIFLLIPNSFILGYLVAAVFSATRRAFNSLRRKA